MNKLIIFYPGTGGNHLGNMIGASMSCENCHSFEKLTEHYLHDNKYANNMKIFKDGHSQIDHFNIQKSIKENLYKDQNNLWIGHWSEVWQTFLENKEKFKQLTEHLEVLVIVSNNFTLSQRYNDSRAVCPDDIKYQYTKMYTEQCFPKWKVSTIDFDTLSKNIEIIEAHLKDTPFRIDTKQARPLHERWLANVFD